MQIAIERKREKRKSTKYEKKWKIKDEKVKERKNRLKKFYEDCC